jgi:RNA ligase (TIGR02306 family)
MRKLASIQRVISISPICGADRIEKIQVLGWQLVARKGGFQLNDHCVYFEIDSLLPDKDTFSFLWSEGYRPKHFRLRSKRLKGVLSQGLALPTSILPPSIKIEEGLDVTDVLGVSKWEAPVGSSAREIAGPFPAHLFPKTDEVRLQSVPKVLEEFQGVECYASLKLDGQSLTFAKYLDGDKEVNAVCTRNLALKDIPGSPHWEVARSLNVFENIPAGFAVQGEFVGEGIQGNRMGFEGKKFFAFQVFDINAQRFLSHHDYLRFCLSRNIPTAQVLWVRKLDMDLDSALEAAQGEYQNGHPREGIVIRPTTEQTSNVIADYLGSYSARASFKVINNSFLLKIGE